MRNVWGIMGIALMALMMTAGSCNGPMQVVQKDYWKVQDPLPDGFQKVTSVEYQLMMNNLEDTFKSATKKDQSDASLWPWLGNSEPVVGKSMVSKAASESYVVRYDFAFDEKNRLSSIDFNGNGGVATADGENLRRLTKVGSGAPLSALLLSHYIFTVQDPLTPFLDFWKITQDDSMPSWMRSLDAVLNHRTDPQPVLYDHARNAVLSLSQYPVIDLSTSGVTDRFYQQDGEKYLSKVAFYQGAADNAALTGAFVVKKEESQVTTIHDNAGNKVEYVYAGDNKWDHVVFSYLVNSTLVQKQVRFIYKNGRLYKMVGEYLVDGKANQIYLTRFDRDSDGKIVSALYTNRLEGADFLHTQYVFGYDGGKRLTKITHVNCTLSFSNSDDDIKGCIDINDSNNPIIEYGYDDQSRINRISDNASFAITAHFDEKSKGPPSFSITNPPAPFDLTTVACDDTSIANWADLCNSPTLPISVCGDGVCDIGESGDVCVVDCGGEPNPDEGTPDGTGGGVGAACGNGTCSGGETVETCPADCKAVVAPFCGDGVCNKGETKANCEADCPKDVFSSVCSSDSECTSPFKCEVSIGKCSAVVTAISAKVNNALTAKWVPQTFPDGHESNRWEVTVYTGQMQEEDKEIVLGTPSYPYTYEAKKPTNITACPLQNNKVFKDLCADIVAGTVTVVENNSIKLTWHDHQWPDSTPVLQWRVFVYSSQGEEVDHEDVSSPSYLWTYGLDKPSQLKVCPMNADRVFMSGCGSVVILK